MRQGKVRYIGTSTHPAWAVMNSIMVSEMKGYARIVCEQPPYNLLDRRLENELLPMCREHGLGVITWSPMAMGVLAGRYTDAAALPEDSRAALRGGFYADRITRRGIETGIEFSKIARRLGPERRATGGRLGEGAARRDGAADRTENRRATGGVPHRHRDGAR